MVQKLGPVTQRNRQAQWRDKFERIRQEFNHAGTEHHFLGLHFTFRYEQIPICPADFEMLIDWRPDCIVTFIDDAYCVRERIHSGGYKSFSLMELVQWRAEEALIGDILARLVNPKSPIPNYIVSVKHPSTMLARLLLGRNVARIYMSYRITETRNHASQRDLIDGFRRLMHAQQNCVAFDPLTIDELPPLNPSLEQNLGDGPLLYDAQNTVLRWPALDPPNALTMDDLSYPIKVPLEEIRDVREAVDAQVKNRDIRLVDQAHFLVVYRPTFAPTPDSPKNPKLSSGVQGEVDYAAATCCPVIWYVKKGHDPLPDSPFADKRPGSDPKMFYEEDDTRFWQYVAQLQKSADRERDYFLR